MSAEMTSHVDVFPTASLKTALAFIQGNPVTKGQVSLAAVNIASYAAGQFFDGDPVPMFAAVESDACCPSKDECEKACNELLASAHSASASTMEAGDQKGKFLTLLQTLLPLLLKLFPRP